MISLVVPTHNRAYALEKVLDTFYVQKKVTEIIFIDDCSTDNTSQVIEHFQKKYMNISTIYFRNEKRSGASFSRQVGVKKASNEYILFCDDDEFLEANYAEVCLKKIQTGKGQIVSGRHMYREVGESVHEAIARFGNGLYHCPLFGKIRYKIYTDAYFEGDAQIPFTHGIFMTTKTLLDKYQIDPFYSRGNGFREESDFQLNAYLNGEKIIITNDTHCVHMNMKEVKTGGQRVNRLVRFYYNIYYTNYFLKKYFQKAQEKMQIPYGFKTAIFLYVSAEFYDFFIRPFWILKNKILRT